MASHTAGGDAAAVVAAAATAVVGPSPIAVMRKRKRGGRQMVSVLICAMGTLLGLQFGETWNFKTQHRLYNSAPFADRTTRYEFRSFNVRLTRIPKEYLALIIGTSSPALSLAVLFSQMLRINESRIALFSTPYFGVS